METDPCIFDGKSQISWEATSGKTQENFAACLMGTQLPCIKGRDRRVFKSQPQGCISLPLICLIFLLFHSHPSPPSHTFQTAETLNIHTSATDPPLVLLSPAQSIFRGMRQPQSHETASEPSQQKLSRSRAFLCLWVTL